MLRVGTLKSFVDFITTVGRLPHIEINKSELNLLPSLRIRYPTSKDKERCTLCVAVMTNGSKVPLRIIFKGTPFIPPARPGKGKSSQPRKGSIAAEITLGNRTRFGHHAGGMPFGVQEKSWCDARECTLRISESWKLRPNNGGIIKQRKSMLALDDLECQTRVSSPTS